MSAKQFLLLLALILSGIAGSFAQDSGAAKAQEAARIEDNSFLIEEAYNQEPGVIQHINTFTRTREGDYSYTFTSEFPVKSLKHQFSFTLPFGKIGTPPTGGRGFGDVMLNYRYQLVGNNRTAVTPRFSLLLATGDSRRERGKGGVGFQVNLPVSVRIFKRFVTHSNVGFTITPIAKNVLGEKAPTIDYNLGQSMVWLATPRFNVLLEAVYNNTQGVTGSRLTKRENQVLINPGVRWAHNFRRKNLQIVPGVAMPLGVGSSRGERGIFLYLSFEHLVGKN